MQLHNTLTRRKEEFIPLKDKEVALYTCGPTVYNTPLIGNWVAYIRWDTLVRTLKADGYKVKRVMNITDVGHLVSDADDGEDKMVKGAKREQISIWDLAQKYTDEFVEGMAKLNLLKPDFMPRATDYIPQQIDLIKKLEDKGFTYITSDGVYFDTAKFPTYGDFAQLDVENLKAGARVAYSEEKRGPTDFALWKFTPEGTKREMEWDSPWGKGFPGWHVECSAMAIDLLGETIDIHTGGIDHIPVHHTNEIAQSEAATGKRFANYWLHNAHLLADGTKISKSLGNGYSLDDLAEKGFLPEDFRMFILQSHYRTESNFTWKNLEAARARRKSFQAVAEMRFQENSVSNDGVSTGELEDMRSAVLRHLSDDLDTPMALTELSDIFQRIETNGVENLEELTRFVGFVDEVLGLMLASTSDITEDQKELIERRESARADKNWEESDKLRKLLNVAGIEVRDTPRGSIWNRS